MGRGMGLRGLSGVALFLLATVGTDAAAQSSRSRSDMLFEPWKTAPHRGAPPSLTRERVGRADTGQGVAAPGEGTFGARRSLPSHLHRQTIDYPTSEPASTIIVDTANTYLYFVLGNGQAIRYGIGVGREGFTWSGRERVSRMAEWPNWRPPADMVARSPDLPDFVPGGLDNPLGARALYLGDTLYRIHGTNEPSSIGTFASSGCIRMLNADVIDLYRRVSVGTQVVVLANSQTTRTR